MTEGRGTTTTERGAIVEYASWANLCLGVVDSDDAVTVHIFSTAPGLIDEAMVTVLGNGYKCYSVRFVEGLGIVAKLLDDYDAQDILDGYYDIMAEDVNIVLFDVVRGEAGRGRFHKAAC